MCGELWLIVFFVIQFNRALIVVRFDDQQIATQMIDHLEKHGLVERFDDESDRRVTLIRMTEAGKASLKASFQQTTTYLDGLFKHLGEEDTQHLMRLMDLVMSYTMSNLYASEEKK